MEKHLKSKQHYIDLYDRHTVKRCRETEQSFDRDDTDLPVDDKIDKKEAARIRRVALDWYLHIQMGERYLNKEKTIRDWMDADKERDELYESARAPEDIRCLACRNRLKPTFKELWPESGKPDRVLFMYDCANECVPRRAFFSDGEEWRVKPSLCLHCNAPLKSETDDDGKRLLTTRTCPKCGYAEKDEIEWSQRKEEEIDENFSRDRDRFCMNDEEGRKFQEEKWNMERASAFIEEFKKKEDARAERLRQNPKGFHLEGAGYTCFVCGDHTPEGDNWYDEHGIKCLVCQKAVDGGEIPASLASDKGSWYSKFDLEYYFNVKGQTLRKWLRDGIIRARTVSKYGEGVHVELFLLEDNKGFLPPKDLVESKSVRQRKDGKDWTTVEKWYRLVDPREHLKGYGIMEHLRVVPPEEVKAREEAKKKETEEKISRKSLKKR
ncbi:MAG: hypothetical protein WC763_01875 [Candidatus Paceibacterota bacterium]|jgi:hypothetical protein